MGGNITGYNLTENGFKIFRFESTIPFSSYLLNLAVGNLQLKTYGKNVRVVTEPRKMNEYLDILKDLQLILDTVENYTGIPYQWGH